jgi:hypothetical protein
VPAAPEIDVAVRAYRRSLEDDDADDTLAASSRALSACEEDPCARAAVAPYGFGRAYDRALPAFVERAWLSRAKVAFAGLQAGHAALGAPAEVLFARAADDLGAPWPERPVVVDVISEAPPLGPRALVPMALATRSRCFTPTGRHARPDDSMQTARIIDCVLVHALLGARQPTALRIALAAELGVREGERAFTLVVIHAVAALVGAWGPRHVSVYRASAHAVEAEALEWLRREWRNGRREPAPIFAARFADVYRASRPSK